MFNIFVIYFSHVFYHAVFSIPCSHVITFNEMAGLLALLCVMFYCVLSFSCIASRVRRATYLYWFLIYAYFSLHVRTLRQILRLSDLDHFLQDHCGDLNPLLSYSHESCA